MLQCRVRDPRDGAEGRAEESCVASYVAAWTEDGLKSPSSAGQTYRQPAIRAVDLSQNLRMVNAEFGSSRRLKLHLNEWRAALQAVVCHVPILGLAIVTVLRQVVHRGHYDGCLGTT